MSLSFTAIQIQQVKQENTWKEIAARRKGSGAVKMGSYLDL